MQTSSTKYQPASITNKATWITRKDKEDSLASETSFHVASSIQANALAFATHKNTAKLAIFTNDRKDEMHSNTMREYASSYHKTSSHDTSVLWTKLRTTQTHFFKRLEPKVSIRSSETVKQLLLTPIYEQTLTSNMSMHSDRKVDGQMSMSSTGYGNNKSKAAEYTNSSASIVLEFNNTNVNVATLKNRDTSTTTDMNSENTIMEISMNTGVSEIGIGLNKDTASNTTSQSYRYTTPTADLNLDNIRTFLSMISEIRHVGNALNNNINATTQSYTESHSLTDINAEYTKQVIHTDTVVSQVDLSVKHFNHTKMVTHSYTDITTKPFMNSDPTINIHSMDTVPSEGEMSLQNDSSRSKVAHDFTSTPIKPALSPVYITKDTLKGEVDMSKKFYNDTNMTTRRYTNAPITNNMKSGYILPFIYSRAGRTKANVSMKYDNNIIISARGHKGTSSTTQINTHFTRSFMLKRATVSVSDISPENESNTKLKTRIYNDSDTNINFTRPTSFTRTGVNVVDVSLKNNSNTYETHLTTSSTRTASDMSFKNTLDNTSNCNKHASRSRKVSHLTLKLQKSTDVPNKISSSNNIISLFLLSTDISSSSSVISKTVTEHTQNPVFITEVAYESETSSSTAATSAPAINTATSAPEINAEPDDGGGFFSSSANIAIIASFVGLTVLTIAGASSYLSLKHVGKNSMYVSLRITFICYFLL